MQILRVRMQPLKISPVNFKLITDARSGWKLGKFEQILAKLRNIYPSKSLGYAVVSNFRGEGGEGGGSKSEGISFPFLSNPFSLDKNAGTSIHLCY